MKTRRDRQAVALVEALFATTLLLVILVALMQLVVSSTRSGAWGTSRLVLEVRGRRSQAELTSTTYDRLAPGEDPTEVALIEPQDDPRYLGLVASASDQVSIREEAPGLLRIETFLTWKDAATGNRTRRLSAVRLRARPTLSLEARHPLTPRDGP